MSFTDVSISDPNLLPIEWANEVIKEMTHTSAVLNLSRRRTMSVRQTRMPATAALATAYWVGSSSNDFTDLKQTTQAEWDGVDLIVEELAALVPIPHAYMMDNGFPVWEEIRPQVVEAMGIRLDQAAIFGIGKPNSWPTAIFPSLQAAGNTVEEGSFADIAADIAESARTLKTTGFNTTGFAAEPGMDWRLVGMRSQDGHPIYTPSLSAGTPSGLYGRPMPEVLNGAWSAADPGDTPITIHGDWQKSIVGIRQDITFTEHPSGVINDSEGAIVFNAMQQDSTIWRAVFRVAWTRANPATRLGPNAGFSGEYPSAGSPSAPVKFPFAAVVPASGA
jgi:HK97 family phage major capsid protein